MNDDSSKGKFSPFLVGFGNSLYKCESSAPRASTDADKAFPFRMQGGTEFKFEGS